MKRIMAIIAGVCFWASAGHAQSLKLGNPEHAGTGCPIGSVAAVLSPDSTKLSLLFDQYVVEAGVNSMSGKMSDRKGCTVAVPLTLPQGWSVSVVRVDYRGYYNIPVGGRGRFDTEYFFAGMRSPRLIESFRPGEDNYTLTDNVLIRGLVWSRCGAQENLRISTSLSVNSNRRGDDVQATLDSIDVDSEVIFQLQWRRCS
jgi:hypothetical protein